MIAPTPILAPVARARGRIGNTLTPYVTAFYRFEESSGSRADSVGSSTLTEVGGSIFSTTGKLGNAAAFIALQQRNLEVPDNAAFGSNNNPNGIPIFIWTWVKLTSLAGTSGAQLIANKFSGTLGTSEFSLYFDTAINRFNYRIFGSGGFDTVTANSFGTPSAGVWYFVMAWTELTIGALKISVNNGPVDSAPMTTSYTRGPGPVRIGGITSAYLDGAIDEFGFGKFPANSGLVPSAAEIAGLYNGGAGVTWPI